MANFGGRVVSLLTNLWAIVALAVGLRILWALLVGVHPVSDAAVFDQLARTLVDHGVFGLTPDTPTAYRAVGTPLLLALAYLVFGAGPVAIVSVNLVASVGIVIGTDWLGRRSFGATAGRLAAVLVACWPALIQFTTVPASELPFIATMLWAIWTWDRAVRADVPWLWILAAGLAFALASLIKPIALLLPLVLAAIHVGRAGFAPLRMVFRSGLVMVLVLLTLTPWAMRNAEVIGAPYLVTSNFWSNVWIGNHAQARGGYVPLTEHAAALSEVDRDEMLRAEVLRDVQDAPALAMARIAWKAILIHRWETIGVHWNAQGITAQWGSAGVTMLKAVSVLWWMGLLAFASVGLVLCYRSHGGWATLTSPPVAIWAYMVAIHSLILVDDRLHMPAIPAIAVMGGLALTQWRHMLFVDMRRTRQGAEGVS